VHLKLLDQLRTAIRVRHYSRRTEDAYVWWVRRYVRFCGVRHPRELGPVDVTRFLSSLAIDRHVSASTQNQALSALVFLYAEVLQLPVGWLEALVRAKRPARVPVATTLQGVRQPRHQRSCQTPSEQWSQDVSASRALLGSCGWKPLFAWRLATSLAAVLC